MSIGIASACGADVDRQRLLVDADLALYRAKSLGRNRFEFYTAALQAEIIDAKRMGDSIIGGLERSEFIPYFQPQVDSRTPRSSAWRRWRVGVTQGAASLLLQRSSISPRSSPSSPRSTARCSRARSPATAAGAGGPPAAAAVGQRLVAPAARGGLIDALSALEIAPGELSFELVESIYLDERDDRFSRTVEQIKALGVDIKIDDFGSGYASIVSLTKIKPRRLKIDRQLVTPIVRSAAQRRLVRSIVEIGRSLGIEVAAEGVETMEHAALLRNLGCTILQGFAFAKPMAAEKFEAQLRTRQRRIA